MGTNSGIPQFTRVDVATAQSSTEASEKQQELIELIETVVSYQFPKMTRKKIENMVQVGRFRESRVHQEAFAEGFANGFANGFAQGRRIGYTKETESITRNLLASKCSLAEIAELTGLSSTHID